ncbi:LysR family transcriptional regulator [Roseococcus sp. DSY-14]|uniref:LysR family transcriptional regulator n=1 Tax=Roseococcus sp. DSY-14 TaxID=3369650 RepID=UPI00387B388C
MMIDALTLDQLRILVAVVDAGSFSAAARRLGRAQSAVSYAIANLEAALRIPLFDRGDWRPRLTEGGRALIADARAILAKADDLKARAKGLAEGLEAELSIVVDIMFPTRALVELVAGFQAEFPGVALDLRVEALGSVPQMVLSGACRLGVQGSLPDIPPELEHLPLPEEVAVEPVAAPAHPLAGARRPLPDAALREQVQVVLTDRSRRTEGRDFAVLSRRSIRTADLGAKHALLRAGLGWGFMPKELVQDDLDAGRLVVLRLGNRRPETRSMPLSLIFLRADPPGPAGRWVTARLTGRGG